MQFKLWLESQKEDEEQKVKELFHMALRALENNGPDPIETMNKSLKNAVSNILPKNTSVRNFVQNRLKHVLTKLSTINPEFRKNVENTTSWLGEEGKNLDKDMKTLFEKMFGDHYKSLINSSEPEPSENKDRINKMEPASTPPDPNAAPPAPQTEQPMMGPDQGATPPPAPEMPTIPPPTNPQVQRPAGSEQGLF